MNDEYVDEQVLAYPHPSPNDGRIASFFHEALPDRIRSAYTHKDKAKSVFNAIVDLWSIANDREVNEPIIGLLNSFVAMPGFLHPESIAHTAVNDLLAVLLLDGAITPASARKIRKALFNRDDLHGVTRPDLFQPAGSNERNPLFRMVYLAAYYPGIFAYLRLQASAARQRESDPNDAYKGWRKECFVPTSLVNAVLWETYHGFVHAMAMPKPLAALNAKDQDLFCIAVSSEVKQIALFAAWQVNPVLLKFDEELVSVLRLSKPTQRIPREILSRLPYWTTAVETPGLTIDGMAVHYIVFGFDSLRFKEDEARDDEFLSLTVSAFGEGSSSWAFHPFSFSLHHDTIESEREATIERVRQNSEDQNVAPRLAQHQSQVPNETIRALFQDRIMRHREIVLSTAVQLALYLCSESPDYSDRSPPSPSLHGRNDKSIAGPPPKKPHEFNVGKVVGAKIRKIKESAGDAVVTTSTGRRVMSPHWRAGHWHLYWKGKGRTEKAVKWLFAFPVAFTPGDRIAVTEREVETDLEEVVAAQEESDSIFIEDAQQRQLS